MKMGGKKEGNEKQLPGSLQRTIQRNTALYVELQINSRN
jgi:hypothetical protein